MSLSTVRILLTRALRPFSAEHYDELAHARLRLYVLLTIALLKLGNFLGGTWDIQWHVTIGRDSLLIPPHLLVAFSFFSGLILILTHITYESSLARAGVELKSVIRVGAVYAPIAFFGVGLGYAGALLSGLFDEWWHRMYGIDAALWSPPHLMMMAATLTVDLSLLIGMTTVAGELGAGVGRSRLIFWGTVLAGSFTLEAVCFQMGEAFLHGYRAGGAGLAGLFYPILVGMMFPLPLSRILNLTRRFWVVVPIFLTTIALQYIGIAIAAIGFAILQPVPAVEEYVRENPESTLAYARAFAEQIGTVGMIGFMQAWSIWLTALPLAFVASLDRLPRVRRNTWLAAPIFSASMVIVSFVWFRMMPTLRDYPTTTFDLILGIVIAVAGGLVLGKIGASLARLAVVPG